MRLLSLTQHLVVLAKSFMSEDRYGIRISDKCYFAQKNYNVGFVLEGSINYRN